MEEDLTEQFLKELEEFEEDVYQQQKLEDKSDFFQNFDELNNIEENGKMDEETLEFFKKTLGDGRIDYIQKQKEDLYEDGLYEKTISKITQIQSDPSEDNLNDDTEAQLIIDAHNLITKISTK